MSAPLRLIYGQRKRFKKIVNLKFIPRVPTQTGPIKNEGKNTESVARMTDEKLNFFPRPPPLSDGK